MKNKFVYRGIVFLTIVLFVGTSVIPSMGVNVVKRNVTQEYETTFTTLGSRGYIQGLIDNASDGDIIFIPSGIYYENIIIDKSITLIGEDRDTTIIDGNYIGDVVYVSADWVNISGFTIQNSSGWWYAGIKINSNHTTITGNNITNNENGIHPKFFSDNNIITGNNINLNNNDGISLRGSGNNIAGNNISSNNWNGIYLYNSSSNNITRNSISKNIRGIYIISSKNNTILKNNFLRNIQYAFSKNCTNIWNQNYWNRPRILPKLIFGTIGINSKEIPWINIDWHPALKPYDIP